MGEIVALTGLSEVSIGDTVADVDNPEALPSIRVDEPTLSVTFGRETGADYLLFCNLVNADIELKNSIFNASTTLSERPKKIVVESFFYLVDTKTGLVCEGKIFSDKTGQILNLLGQYGKAMTAENLLQCMFEVQSKRIVEDMCNEGKKILAGGN